MIILRQINEAISCLQEGVVTAQDIDLSMVLGTGFPNKDGIGGPLHLFKTCVWSGRLSRKIGK